MSETKLINSLNNLAYSLAVFAEQFDAYIKADKSLKKDIANSKDIAKNVKNLDSSIANIQSDTKQILKNQKKILEKISMEKKESTENSFLSSMGTEKISENIKKGASSILLIAGAVLAIGTAFKIIGSVDFMSVIAIAISIGILVKAFENITESKLTIPGSMRASSILLILSTGILGSAFLVKMLPQIEAGQFFTFGVLVGTFALMSFGLSKLVNSAERMSLKGALLLPIMLPAISLGIMLSSYFLSDIKPVDDTFIPNMLNMSIGLAIAMTIMALPVFIFGKMGGSIVKGSLISIIAMPAISLAIMLSSLILTNGDYSNPMPIGWVLSFSIAMGLLSIPVSILGFIPLPIIISGAAALVILSGALLVSSMILSQISGGDTFKVVADGFSYFIGVVGKAVITFASSAFPLIVMIAQQLAEKVLPPLAKFIKAILPPLGDFLGRVINSFLPIIKEIISVVKVLVGEIQNILTGFANIFTSVASVIEVIGGVFKIVGDTIVSSFSAVKDIIVAISDGIVSVIDTVTNSIVRLSMIDGQNLFLVGGGLGAIAAGLLALTASDLLSGLGGLAKMVMGKQNSIFDNLINIGKYGKDIESAGVGVTKLASGFKSLLEISADSNNVVSLNNLLDKMANIKSSQVSVVNENITRQVVDSGTISQNVKISDSSRDNKFDTMIEELRMIKQQIGIVANNSGNISSILGSMRSDKLSSVDL